MESGDQRADIPSHSRSVDNTRLRNVLVINEPGNDENNANNPNNVNVNNININNNNDRNVIPYRRDPDQLIPASNINRIVRRILPSHARVSEDCKELLQECTSEFISFITAEANERCQQEYRKTIGADDILYAFSRLGFDNYVEPLTLFLDRNRQSEAAQTVVQGNPSMRRTTNFPSAVQPLPPSLPPHMPNSNTAPSAAYSYNYDQTVQNEQRLFGPATTNQYNFQDGGSGDPDESS